MNHSVIVPETTINDELAAKLSISTPRSALLEEAAVNAPFATFFVSTRLQSESLGINLDFPTIYDIDGTSLIQHSPVRRVVTGQSQARIKEEDSFAKPNNDRMVLLARKYVSKEQLSDEDSARLAIVTERIRKLEPSVTTSDVDALDRLLALTDKIVVANNQIRATLNKTPEGNE